MPLITITHNFGVDGKTVAQKVAQKIGVEVFDNQKLQSIIAKKTWAKSTAYDFDQRAPGFWDRLRSQEPQLYLDTMEAAVYDIANQGDGVIIGHGSQMLLRDFDCAFHVRLACKFRLRVENLIALQDITSDEAEKLIARYDKNQRSFFTYAFQVDFDEPSLYDLILNLGKMNEETIAKLIVEALDSDDIRSCSFDALSSMKRMSQERKIHAELLGSNIDVSTIKVTVSDNGKALITGGTVSKAEKDKIATIVNNVDGISQVDNDLTVWVYPL